MITTLIAIVNTDTEDGVNDYSVNYKITDKDHVHVFYVDGEEPEVELVQVSSFTAGDDNEYKINAITASGFNVELRDTYDASDNRKISIRRTVPLTQEVEYPPGNDFPGSTHERALDKLTAIVQQFNEQIERQIGMPLSEDATETNLPNFIPNYYLGLDGDNNFIWKTGTVAVGNDEIKDSHIDWGTGANQVSAVDMPIADAGGKITATEVEGALQENRAAIDVTESALDTEEAALVTHKANNGSDHSFIDQDVKAAAGPTFNGGVQTDGTKLRTKVIEIGDWNMTSDSQKQVAHGIGDFTKIRSLAFIVRRDDNAVFYPAPSDGSSIGGASKLHFSSLNTTNVILDRIASSIFDGGNFVTTPFNRGWITIQYEV